MWNSDVKSNILRTGRIPFDILHLPLTSLRVVLKVEGIKVLKQLAKVLIIICIHLESVHPSWIIIFKRPYRYIEMCMSSNLILGELVIAEWIRV